MRMKFNKSSQLLLVSAAGLLGALLLTACSQFTQTLTVDFVFVASSKAAGSNNYGEIDIFEVNSESGHMRQIPASPVPSGGRLPVAEAVSSDNKDLFVVNQDDNNIVQFVIGNDGKLYPYNTVNTPGVFPLAIAVNATNLFVVDTYQPLPSCSTAAPCSGSIAVFQLTAGGSSSSAPCTATVCIVTPAVTNPTLSASYWPLTLAGKPSDVIVPTAVSILGSGGYVYVTAYDSSVTPSVGYVFGFSVAPPSTATVPPGGTCPLSGPVSPNILPSGTLCPLNGGAPFAAGTQPSAIASSSSSSAAYLYVTDLKNNDVLGYTVAATTGLLAPLAGSPFPAGNAPSAIVVDPSFPYAYVANSTDSSITAYSMSSGALTRLGSSTTGGLSYPTGLQPVAIGIDPSTNHFLYTANFLGNNVSGFELSQTAGTLLDAQLSPFAANDQPTAVAAIPHGGTGSGIQP
jgi:6-phosphogluconolactonase (cycloisomerase 2 family)